MKILFSTILSILLFVSCTEETTLELTQEQQADLEFFVQEFESMSAEESELLRAKLLDFYEVATVNNCDPGAFGIITTEEVDEYLRNLGFGSIRSMHDWTVDFGMKLQDVLDANDQWDDHELLTQLISDLYHDLSLSPSDCELDMFIEYSIKALDLAETFGVYIAGSGFRQVTNAQLFLFGGAFNTFVRIQDDQDTCITNRPS